MCSQSFALATFIFLSALLTGSDIRGVGVVIFQRIESTTLGSNEAIVPNKAREENRSGIGTANLSATGLNFRREQLVMRRFACPLLKNFNYNIADVTIPWCWHIIRIVLCCTICSKETVNMPDAFINFAKLLLKRSSHFCKPALLHS